MKKTKSRHSDIYQIFFTNKFKNNISHYNYNAFSKSSEIYYEHLRRILDLFRAETKNNKNELLKFVFGSF